MPGSDGIEYKRKNSRETIRFKAEIMVDGNRHNCRILNISTGGAKIEIDRHINRGIGVFLQIGKFGQFRATVVWQQNREMGVKFNHDESEMASVIMGLASYG